VNGRALTGGSLYVGITVLIAAVAAWPIYASASYLLLVAVAVVVGAGIAVLATWRRFGGLIVAGLLAAAFVVLAVPLAVPSRLGGLGDILRGLGEALSGVVFAWKDLVTVELPVGSYRNLLVPALVVFLVGTCVALLLSWRTDRWATAAVPVGLALTGYGLFFGRTSVSAPLSLGPVTLYAPVETAIGVAALVSALLWLAWRTHDDRARALHRAATASGVRLSRRPSRTDRRRTALGAGMVALALVVTVAVVPWAARGAQRDVLRAAAGPERDIASAVSPLSDYRAQFAPERADEVLFRVSGEQLPDRVRLATLDTYDGEIFRAEGGADADVETDAAFVRVPAVLDTGEGAAVDARIEIEALDGIWMPTAGELSAVEFAGDRSAALSDGFYYSTASNAGVQTAGGGLEPGDAYRLRAVEPDVTPLGEVAAPGGDPDGVQAPDNLRRWVEQHASGEGGAALADLVGLLRERGFLSHALEIGDEPPSWTTALAGYTFQPSASGHSLARVDTLFSRLLERESDPRAEASGNYVAAVGDDEQFATATALIARELGFPARVVVGARLTADDDSVAACEDGECRARDLSAWTEVLSGDGSWVPIDVTPQWRQSPSLEVTEQRDPEIVTEVRPDSVEEVVPPAPVQEDSARDDTDEESSGVDLAWLWPVLRIAGLVLLALAILLGPFIVVIGAKAARRRGRRLAATPAERIAGGWEEYVDAGVDSGRDAPRVLTRSELAVAYGTASGAELAVVADRAIFSREATTQDDAEEFWRIVDAERRAMRRERGMGRRLLAAVSLRSFLRILAPRTPVRMPRIVERGRRRASRRGRTTS
jgi:hypothetical protein